ncbi:MAG: NADPH-dependent oxidoreductase [candidate division Zixibacteria bacterium]|nr:NADPH-dependent oxidoreductase [candidate division Zixibacteria bacterium]
MNETTAAREFPAALDKLRSHRSVRQFTNEPVSDECLEAIISTAQRASTSSNLQSYSVIVVRDPERRKQLSPLCGGQAQVTDCPVFLAFCADLNRAKVLCEASGYAFSARFIEYFLVAVTDATIFGQTALAAAEALGLGGCMIGAARNHPEEISQLLQLPPLVFVVFGMTLGHPRTDQKVTLRPRLPLAAIMHHEQYDSSKWQSAHAAYDGAMKATGIYDGRRIDLSRRVEKWQDVTPEGAYGWIEHSARRWIDPAAQRRQLRPFFDKQGFGFE